jgi:hypothetical protein
MIIGAAATAARTVVVATAAGDRHARPWRQRHNGRTRHSADTECGQEDQPAHAA